MHLPTFATFSLVALDKQTGQLGIAGASHWFAYGKNIPYIQAGRGAIATQASTHIEYAIEGLQLLKDKNAEDTLEEILEKDPDTTGYYQVLMIDAQGNTAGYTGKNTFPYANHLLEKNVGFAGNFLANENVLPEMQKYYHDSQEPFALKLIKTLQKGQEAGGDIRGKKSIALKVVAAKGSDKPWTDVLYDLRIDDHNDPLQEIERQYYVAESFNFMNQAIEATPQQRVVLLHKAIEVSPENSEAYFWLADSYWEVGEKEKALEVKETLTKKYGINWDVLWDIVREKRLQEK
jgi:uncharacterized Ntn-hydrolase superfamily protein